MQPVVAFHISLAIAAFAAADGLAAVTPCDFDSGKHGGQVIEVSTKLLFTMHGTFLVADLCTTKGQHSAALAFPGDPGVPKVPYSLDSQAIAQLRPFFRTTGGQAIACAVVNGELVYKSKFKLQHINGDVIGNGFGAEGRLRAAFILQSVNSIRPCE
jgi:hypothetical protein